MTRILLRSLVLASAVHGVAWACSCLVDDRTAEEHLAEDEIVAWGTVVALPGAGAPAGGGGGGCAGAKEPPLDDSAFTYDVELEVEEGFKGAVAGEVVTIRASEGSSCAVTVREGERWLVLLGPAEAINSCNVSHLAEDDDPMLQALRAASGG